MSTRDHTICVRDATTLSGLAGLRRARPSDWHLAMRDGARLLEADAKVEEVLRAGGEGLLLPRASTDAEARRMKKQRHCARRLVELCGDRRLARIDEAALGRLRRGVGRHALAPSADVAGACITLLRHVAERFQGRHSGGITRVAPRLPPEPRPPLGAAPERPIAPWSSIEQILLRGPHRLRAAVALQLHCGATPGQVLSLRVRQVDLAQGLVVIGARGVRGRPGERGRLVYPLPRDAIRAIQPWLLKRRAAGPDAPLLPRTRTAEAAHALDLPGPAPRKLQARL